MKNLQDDKSYKAGMLLGWDATAMKKTTRQKIMLCDYKQLFSHNLTGGWSLLVCIPRLQPGNEKNI